MDYAKTEEEEKNQLRDTQMTTASVWDTAFIRAEKPQDKEMIAQLNIGVLGNSDVGKTSLINKYRDPKSELGPKHTTYGTDIISVYLNVQSTAVIRVRLWDTAGQEKNSSVSKQYTQNLDACLLVFDLTNKSSYESVTKWLKELKNIKDVPAILIGNKVDLEEAREVSGQEIDELKGKCRLQVFETSALTGINVISAFHCLVYQVLKPCLDIKDMLRDELESQGLNGPIYQVLEQQEDLTEMLRKSYPERADMANLSVNQLSLAHQLSNGTLQSYIENQSERASNYDKG